MSIELNRVDLRVVSVKTRMPFRYGIAVLSEAPYVLAFADFVVDGVQSRGVAADVLPPKWFTKQPERPLNEEIAEMKAVIRRASESALEVGEQPSVFDWQRRLYQEQFEDEQLNTLPPLLKGFGVSLLERAAIDSYCRRHEITFAEAVRKNRLGIRLGDYHGELRGAQPGDLLPVCPSNKVSVRHTVGLSDPLLSSDVPEEERLTDGLPQALDDCIRRYGLTHFKIKVPAEADAARNRLRAIARVIESACKNYCFTLDGNEFFRNPESFRAFWRELAADPVLDGFIRRGLKLVEQPLHREQALSTEVAGTFAAWADRPPIIIDESDGQIESFAQALEIGYDGTSHKNCKGVIKGLANACLVAHQNKHRRHRPLVITGEDLMNLGPVALLQDLAVVATLGLSHVERNGHHYVAGLSVFPDSVRETVAKTHGDLYETHPTQTGVSWPSLRIEQGKIALGTVVEAPFGCAFELSPDSFDPLGD